MDEYERGFKDGYKDGLQSRLCEELTPFMQGLMVGISDAIKGVPKTPTVWQDEMTQVYQLCYNCMLFNNSNEHPMCLIGGCEAAVINEQLLDALKESEAVDNE